MSFPFDPMWTTATARGNQGGNLRLGLLEADPDGRHRLMMEKWHRRICPQAQLIVGDARLGGSELWRLVQSGCSVVAMPFVLPSVPPGQPVPTWDPYIVNSAANGVLLFGGVGNNTAQTPTPTALYPATHPQVFACAACFPATGELDPSGSTPNGRIDLAVPCDGDGSSGASVVAACIAVQWLGAGGVYLFSGPAARLHGFRSWVSASCTPLPGGRGYVPYAGSL